MVLSHYTVWCNVPCMNKFKSFFMSLVVAERIRFAERCGTSKGHLTNIAYGKPCAESLAINIERESLGAVRCEDLCPAVDWAFIRNTQPKQAA